MSVKKVSNIELEKLVADGNTVSEIARKLKVSKGTISRRLKALRTALSKDVAIRSAQEIVETKIDAMKQLIQINEAINAELNHIRELIETATGKEREALQKQQLDHVGEIRKQVGLFLQIAQALYNAEEVARFQQITLEEIGRAAPEVRIGIMERLNECRLVRSTMRPT